MKVIYSTGKNRQEILVDDEDYEYLNQFKWKAEWDKNTYYARRTFMVDRKITRIRMHREISKAKKGQIIDHKNGNGLHNFKLNLRDSTGAQNMMNSKKRKNCGSKYKGVTLNVYKKKFVNKNGEEKIVIYTNWMASIRIDGVLKTLGRFKEEVQAAKCYNVACIKYFGKFANPNRDENGNIL